jgi:protein-glutamine gamma-glutamyltransferase
MKTPPLLLGAALLFWGWQAEFLFAGAIMAVILEGARVIKWRWEFSDDDFSRIWTVCTVMFLGAVVYAFTDNGGPARFGHLLQNSNLATLNNAGTASARTASAILRWLPMMLFLFVAAQAYSSRPEIPLITISLILRRRWKRAEKLGRPMPVAHTMNVAYPFFAVCLFAASIHASENNTYFVGLCVLLAWALWSRRTRRYGSWVWAGALGAVFVAGYFGQHGIGQLQSYIQNLDTQWLARFLRGRVPDATQSRTAIGQIGELKTSTRIVIRLKTPHEAEPPAYLREASYRVFAPPNNWKVSSIKDDFDQVPYGTTNTTWLLLPEKTNTTSQVQIACYLEGRTREPEAPTGLLPLPTGCGRIENLPAFTLRRNGAGAVLAEGPGLVIFDAHYGPGATADDPPQMTLHTNDDLVVPLREQAALDQVISELHLGGSTNPTTDQVLRAISFYFQSQYTYSTWQRPEAPPEPALPIRPGGLRAASTNETPLARFLLRTHSGHCEYFATATVLLLRQMRIPARYAVGYAVHEPAGDGYVVRQRDAHAWCLVWDQEAGCWRDFDTTPASWFDEESKASRWLWLADFWSWLKFQLAKFRWGQSHFQRYVLLILGPVLALLIAQIFFRRRRQRARQKEKDTGRTLVWPGLDSEFYQVEQKLTERGAIRRLNEPLTEWLARAVKSNPAATGAAEPLRDLLRLHYRYRFDPQGLTETDREELKQRTRTALDILENEKVNRN